MFLWYPRGTSKNLKFLLISIVNVYYDINKLIILVSDPH
jgi:hypothetical protein